VPGTNAMHYTFDWAKIEHQDRERLRMKRAHTQAETKAFGLIQSKLREIATDTLYIYAEPIDPVYLYELLIPPSDFQTLMDASLLMPRVGKWIVDNLRLATSLTPEVRTIIEYSLNYKTATERTQWLWPKYLMYVSYDNELGQRLLPLVDLAIQWRTTIELYSLFYNNFVPLSLTTHMLPWLKLVIPKVLSDSNDPSVFRYFKRCLDAGTPRYVPGVSQWFGNVCGYGTELVSLYNIIKDKPKPHSQGEVVMVPVLTSELIEDGLIDHFNEFYNTMTGAQLQSPIRDFSNDYMQE
jgi:hypothetical protein